MNFVISLLMPGLWIWIIFDVEEGDIPEVVCVILLLHISAIIIEWRKGKKNRFIAKLGIIATLVAITAFFSGIRGSWALNSIFFGSISFFYLFYFLETAEAFFKALKTKSK